MKSTVAVYKGKSMFCLSLMYFHVYTVIPTWNKDSSGIKEKLKKVYSVYYLPKKIQTDNGGGFKKCVNKFCTTNKVKMDRWWPCQPFLQDKVKRFHRILNQKIHCDMVKQTTYDLLIAKLHGWTLIWMPSTWYLIICQEGNKDSKSIPDLSHIWIYFKVSRKHQFKDRYYSIYFSVSYFYLLNKLILRVMQMIALRMCVLKILTSF